MLTNEINEFINFYSKAILEGYAAVFAGAGLSIPSGFLSWKELIEPFAKSINLSTDKETDYLAIAQFYFNDRRNRSRINNEILNEFNKRTSKNENINILTRLPISTYWTTNYDHLLEEGIKENNRKVDIKITEKDLATHLYDRDAVVYKMHGDVQSPYEAVIIKDDYETYDFKRGLFTTALKGDLVSKTFLFIGFSFEDPNLNRILAKIKALLDTNVREHFCFFKKISELEEDSSYKKAKQELIIQDLKRYGIHSIMLDSYDDITEILREIEKRCYLKNIFLSGSMSADQNGWHTKQAEDFAHLLSKSLVANNYKITSGFGLGIGSAVINGALEEIIENKFKHIDEYLRLRPFPQINSGNTPVSSLWTQYREEMIRECGVAVFIFGNKIEDKQTQLSNGMLEEFQIAKKHGLRIVPVGSTGCTADKIYEEMFSEKGEYPYLNESWSLLKKSKESKIIAKIVSKVSKFNAE
jgi:hypothetical protein